MPGNDGTLYVLCHAFQGIDLSKGSRDGVPQSFRRRLLVDAVCAREESAGHPQDSTAADAAAIAAGGNFANRLDARAHVLPEAQSLLAAIGSTICAGSLIWTAAAILGLLLGWAAGSAILSSRPINLPLTLGGLVGLNLVMLVAWIVFSFSPLGWMLYRAFVWLSEHPVSQRMSHARREIAGRGVQNTNESATTSDVVRVLAADGRGRWLIGSGMHTVWLSFALACAATLWISLLFRSYPFSWESTLLDSHSLARIATLLSWLPAKLHLIDMHSLSVSDTGSAGARQVWGWWLVWTTILYGALPRALALCACLALFWRSARNIGRDFERPGYARLRARLMPTSAARGVYDPDRVGVPQVVPAPIVALHGSVHGLGLDGAARFGAPSIDDVEWIWLGQVDNAPTEEAVLQRLQQEQVSTLAVVVRATMSPDRGVERIVRELKDAAHAPLVIVLDDIHLLDRRGLAVSATRNLHWKELAARVGAIGIVPHKGGLPLRGEPA
jgi:hypothetical protein